MTETLACDALRGVVAGLTGLRLRPDDDDKLARLLAERIHASGANGQQDYLARLGAPSPAGQRERRAITIALVPPETYFFRDAGQIELLRSTLLPERIAARHPAQVLRLWSAGCSTGEEAYTLAILASEALPPPSGWQIAILGTDISADALAAARQARYGEWSFRGVDDSLRERYFIPAGTGEWQVREAIRSMVYFAEDDLLAPADNPQPGDFDIVLCRNLLIYLLPEAGRHVLGRLAAALTPGGYAVLGHNEGMEQEPPELEIRVIAESVVFQRRGQPDAARPVAACSPARAPSPARRPGRPPLHAASLQDRLRRAWKDADAGRAQAAHKACEALIEEDAMSPDAYYLLAHLAEEAGDCKEALRLLKRVIYLAPDHAMAYLDLSILHRARGEVRKARRDRATALRLLKRLPLRAALPPLGEHTAGELLAAARRRISGRAGA